MLLFATISHAEVNRQSIAVPLLGTQGPASSYPSTLTVKSVNGPNHVSPFAVTLYGVTHPCAQELAILLVHQVSQNTPLEKYLLLSGAGGCRPFQGTTIQFVNSSKMLRLEEAPAPDPNEPFGAIVRGEPENEGTPPMFPAPAPAGAYTAFPETVNVNGVWSLYVLDVGGKGRGVIAGGWSLTYDRTVDIRMPKPVDVPVSNNSGKAGIYPIPFDLSGAAETEKVDSKNLALYLRLKHDKPSDLRLLLKSPSGTSVLLMATAGGDNPFDGRLSFYDEAVKTLPKDLIEAGDYKPGAIYEKLEKVELDAPAPKPPYQTEFKAFNGEPLAGVWELYVYDRTPATGSGVLVDAELLIRREPKALDITVAPLPATAQQPFLRLAGDVREVSVIEREALTAAAGEATKYPALAAIWRVFNEGKFYAAGAFDLTAGTARIATDVPLKKGKNTFQIVLGSEDTYVRAIDVTEYVKVDEFRYVLAEGATGGFFDTDVTLANASGKAAPITLDFLPEGGTPLNADKSIDAYAPLQVHADDVVPGAATSTVVHSLDAVPLAVERTMSWDSRGYGGHGGGAVSPATRWFFAEGAQGFFKTFILLANDNDTAVDVTVNFLIEDGPVVKHVVTVPAQSRKTVDAGSVKGVNDTSFGLDISSPKPIIAERAMYFTAVNTDHVFDGGHESAGVNEPSKRWFLAEGATGPFFDCFVLISNPNESPAQVTLKYLLADGTTIPQTVTVPAKSRKTINVETVDAKLGNAAVSTTVTSDVGIIVERAMYWPNFSEGWREAHNSFGVTDAALRWAVADGRLAGKRGYETYILLANPNPVPAEVIVRFLKVGRTEPVTRTYKVAPTSRLNIQPSAEIPELGEGVFSAEVEVLNYQPIAVEKAMYWNSEGVIWAAGTNVTATRLPPQ
jgi:hypothetical protein